MWLKKSNLEKLQNENEYTVLIINTYGTVKKLVKNKNNHLNCQNVCTVNYKKQKVSEKI